MIIYKPKSVNNLDYDMISCFLKSKGVPSSLVENYSLSIIESAKLKKTSVQKIIDLLGTSVDLDDDIYFYVNSVQTEQNQILGTARPAANSTSLKNRYIRA